MKLPYSQKEIERLLFMCCGPEVTKDKDMRRILKNTAKEAAQCFRVGLVDGQKGAAQKKIVWSTEKPNRPEYMTDILEFIQTMYDQGYELGKAGG